MRRRLHLSRVRTDGVRPLATGGIAIDAVVSQAGVLTYQTPTGPVREFRTPDIITDRAGLESLVGVAITVRHPADRAVTIDNYRDVVVGHVASVRVDSDQVWAVLHIHDRETLEAIGRAELLEISPGYEVDLTPTPGIDPVYGPYDAVTTAMAYNHVALLPPGGGRQGAEVSLRLDAADEPALSYTDPPVRNDIEMDPEAIQALIAESLPSTEDLVAKVAEIVSAQMPALIAAALQEATAAAAGAEEPAAEEPAAEPPVTDQDPAGPPAGDLEDQAALDQMPVEQRLDAGLLEAVRVFERIAGTPADLKLTKRAILEAAATKAGVEVRTDASDDRLLGLLEARAARNSTSGLSYGELRTDGGAPNPDAKPEITAEEGNRLARERVLERQRARLNQ